MAIVRPERWRVLRVRGIGCGTRVARSEKSEARGVGVRGIGSMPSLCSVNLNV